MQAFGLGASSRSGIVRNAGILAVSTIIATCMTFAAVILNAKALGAQGLGILAVLQAIVAVLIGVLSFGTQQPLIRLGAGAIGNGAKGQIGELFAFALILDCISGAGAAVIGVGIIGAFGPLLGVPEGLQAAAQCFAAASVFVWTGATNGVLRLLDRFDLLGASQVAVAAAVLLISALFYATEVKLVWYLIGFAVTAVLSSLLQVVIVLRLLRAANVEVRILMGSKKLQQNFTHFRDYIWVTGTTGTMDAIRLHADTLLLGYFFGPSAVGVYNVVKQIAGVLRKVAGIASSTVFPVASEMAVLNHRDAARHTVRKSIVVGISLGGIAFAAGGLFGQQFIAVAFGPAFADGYLALLIAILAGVFVFVGSTLTAFIQAFAGPRPIFVVYGSAFVTFLAIGPVLIGSFGVTGSATAQLLFYAVATSGSAWYWHARIMHESRDSEAKS